MFLAKFRPDFSTPPPAPRSERREATVARERAEAALRVAQMQSAQAGDIAESLRNQRIRNHFGESVDLALRPK